MFVVTRPILLVQVKFCQAVWDICRIVPRRSRHHASPGWGSLVCVGRGWYSSIFLCGVTWPCVSNVGTKTLWYILLNQWWHDDNMCWCTKAPLPRQCHHSIGRNLSNQCHECSYAPIIIITLEPFNRVSQPNDEFGSRNIRKIINTKRLSYHLWALHSVLRSLFWWRSCRRHFRLLQ